MLDKTYSPEQNEQQLYQQWENQGYFKPNNNQQAYCIMIPPPNVTGNLHMGHAFQQAIMDALTRYHRMQGKSALWQVGTDHAGIATQMVVERKLQAENQPSRTTLGRDAFTKKVWEWKRTSGGNITQQMRRLGNSVDWQRERFTMDDSLSQAVQRVFIQLYKEQLIYRGKRLVNWDPKLQTAISDLEVENKEKQGHLWHFRYPLADGVTTTSGLNYLTIATTRPETMLGDTAIAVHPKDERYQSLIGQHILLPLVNRKIPIIADDYVDREFGTGCVKITPAHDFNDYAIGQRHQLPLISILDKQGHLLEEAEYYNNVQTLEPSTLILPTEFAGQDRFQARKLIISAMDKLQLLEKIDDHKLKVPYGDRSGVVIEPLLTDQWYVKTQPLAEPAIKAVESGQIEFVPKQYENLYFAWMRDIQDWCISRQLWWGHRIPAWYDEQGNVYVGEDEASIRTEYQLADTVVLKQDDDVLDTWFSSALWTFSTLGWPQQTADLIKFHPTDVLVTGFDIIFFWVARMIMMTMHFIKDEQGQPQIPFKQVYVTGLIRDEDGQKMSKSKGNVLDPLDMIDGISFEDLLTKRTGNMMQPVLAEKIAKRTKKLFPEGIQAHGTDALRFTLIALASTGRDINWDMNRLAGYRNFCNKLWNASRYVLMNTEEHDCVATGKSSLADQWILSQLQQTIRQVEQHFEQYRFDRIAQTLYEFTWDYFCDWYLELTKPILQQGSPEEQQQTRYTLLTVLEQLLRLLHPIMPFITETIWLQVAPLLGNKEATIMSQAYPQINEQLINQQATTQLEWIQQFIIGIRNIRGEMNIAPTKALSVLIKTSNENEQRLIVEYQAYLQQLSHLEQIEFIDGNKAIPLSATALVGQTEILIPMAGLIDITEELKRIHKSMLKLTIDLKRVQGKLANANFVDKAPAAVIAKEQQKQQELEQTLQKLHAQEQQLQAAYVQE